MVYARSFLVFCALFSSIDTDPLTRSGAAIFWKHFANRLILTSTVDSADNVHTVAGCILMCLENTNCVSGFFRTSQKHCQLHDVLFLSPEDGLEDNGTVYYSLTADSCPVYYVHNRYLQMCYQPHMDKILYTAGLSDCQSRGEHFIIIDSQQKQDHVKKQITSSSGATASSWYIDGSDSVTEGQWIYHDGRPVTFFSWADGYPKNATANRDYLLMTKFEGTFLWQDRKQGETKFYFCQIDL